jgi:hypothetical protein
MSRASLVVATLALALACKGPAVPNPMTGETRYTCCNIHYEKTEITDVNYLTGAVIPFGTRVQILEVRKNSVKFQPEGQPPITLVLRHGRKVLAMDEYLNRLFLREDPHAKLSTPKPAKGGKGAAAAETDKTRKNIEQGVVDVGMTKEQVLMAVGYPPAHRTPSLQSPVWTYWSNHWSSFEVYFDGDRVSRVSR